MEINFLPYLNKNTSSTLLTLSAAAFALLLLASPLPPLSNILLQPVQAQTLVNFVTPQGAHDGFALFFNAYGTTASTSNPYRVDITSQTFRLYANGAILEGEINRATLVNTSRGWTINFESTINNPDNPGSERIPYFVFTQCSTSESNLVSFTNGSTWRSSNLFGAVDCRSPLIHTTQSSSMTGSSQDSDSDGIPDSSDRCASNSNQRCYKESK